MRFKRKIASSCMIAGLLLGASVVPAQASLTAPRESRSSIAQNLQAEAVAPVSEKQIDEYLDALAENFKKATATGDSVAKQGLKKLNSLSYGKKRELAITAITTNLMESSSNEVKIVESSSPIQPARAAAVPTKTLRQPVACYRATSVFGVPLTQVKISGAVWSKNYGRTLVKVDKPTARVSYNYDPVMTVSFSGHNSWKSKNTGFFEVETEASRKVGHIGSSKGATLRLVASSYGVVKTCAWVD